MNRSVFLVLALAAPFPTMATASAQTRVVLTPYVGAWMVDDDLSDFDFELPVLEVPDGSPLPLPEFSAEVETGLLVGLRVGVPVGQRWTVEGSYGYSAFDTSVDLDAGLPLTGGFSLQFLEHSAHLFHGALRWTPTLESRVRPFLVGGVGGVRMSTAFSFLGFLDEEDELSDTDLLLTVGGGVAIPLREGFSVRAEVRDDLQFCDDLCLGSDETLHHIELTGGLEIEL